MVVLGVIIFAGSSALCGLTPRGGLAETWIVAFRAVQGLGGAIMFPAALAIVVQTFELRSRGRALTLFFGIAGGPDRDRPDRGRLPAGVDLASDLLAGAIRPSSCASSRAC
jgi:MFS family permease